jgi:DNA-binding transcriptional regulator YiaG
MTAKQFQAAIDKLGLSQQGAARLLRRDVRTARKWIKANKVPWAEGAILTWLVNGRLTLADIEAGK